MVNSIFMGSLKFPGFISTQFTTETDFYSHVLFHKYIVYFNIFWLKLQIQKCIYDKNIRD